MLLNEFEKSKFVAYLRQNIDSSKQMVEQFQKLPESLPKGELIRRERLKIAGYSVVLNDLLSAESINVGGNDVGEVSKTD